MKVALYYPWIYLMSGGERVILELVRRSRHEWTLLTNHFDPDQTFPELREMHVTQLKPVSVKRDVLTTARSALTILSQKLPEADYNVLLVLSEGLGDLINFRNRRRPSICYCLTPLRAAFDPVYRQQAEAARGRIGRFVLRQSLRLFAAADRLAWRRYTRVLFVSREAAIRARAARLCGPEAGIIVYPGMGLASSAAPERFDPYFLIPGRIMWTKHVELGIRAFQTFAARADGRTQMRLVVAGLVDAKSRPYLAQLQEIAAGDPRIEFRVAPSDSELRGLYEHCYAVLFTALNEDLGLVPIEAMASGKAVVAVNRGGPTETIEDGVQGFLVEPTAEAFAERMAALAADPDRTRAMGRAGMARARLFSWEQFVSRVDGIVDELAAGASAPAERRLAPAAASPPVPRRSGQNNV